MRDRALWIVLGTLCLAHAGCGGQSPTEPTPEEPVDHRAGLRGALQTLSQESADQLFRLHFSSMIQVIDAADRRSAADNKNINKLWKTFRGCRASTAPGCARAT